MIDSLMTDDLFIKYNNSLPTINDTIKTDYAHQKFFLIYFFFMFFFWSLFFMNFFTNQKKKKII